METGSTYQGPDLQNIIRQSYNKVMTMTEVMTNHTTDAIYKKSYDKVMINLWHNLQQSYDHHFVVITLLQVYYDCCQRKQ